MIVLELEFITCFISSLVNEGADLFLIFSMESIAAFSAILPLKSRFTQNVAPFKEAESAGQGS